MPLRLLPMELEDCHEWVRIRSIAYRGPTSTIVHHRRMSDASFAKVVEGQKKEFYEPGTWHWKVVDMDSGEMVAAARWCAQNFSKSDTEIVRSGSDDTDDNEPPYIPPEVNVPALSALLGPLRQAGEEIMGARPYLMLDTLSTLPEHQRRGAGSMILKWGVEKADEMGVEMYLTSSSMARPLYERWGFEVVRELQFDRTPWGGEGVDRHTCMLRKPIKGKAPTDHTRGLFILSNGERDQHGGDPCVCSPGNPQ
ncbi:acyl-CoA N-acyltransferase [Lepidopterella palustris CBS 459.81]|uniref:Acyl-CoA N-acyltransferase n=1 Tax=Lepidopterella palustris CBS 459.81 TaxID=1314670 RepID=A0A8E2JAA3_9PEZI|nr:acyl-CoA N-acyltransferase [Lepidopterella palustris CBS 459.81]